MGWWSLGIGRWEKRASAPPGAADHSEGGSTSRGPPVYSGKSCKRNMRFGGYVSGVKRLGRVPDSQETGLTSLQPTGLEFAPQPAMLGTAGPEQDPKMA